MLITILALCALNTLLTLVALYRTRRIIADQDEQSDAFITAINFQTGKLRELRDIVESALDCLLINDSKAAASRDTD